MSSKLRLHILASGSKGNAAIIETDETAILVDCGISRKQLLLRAEYLGVDIDKVKFVLLTHEHSDHTKGLKIFNKYHQVLMFTTQGTAEAKKATQELPFEIVRHSDEFYLGPVKVSCFPTSHDVMDPMGFRFDYKGDSLGYCTDTGYLTDESIKLLTDTRILAIESNHDEKMLQNGDYPRYLKDRIASDLGHLSNAQTNDYLNQLVTDRCEQIIGMHLSQDNNLPSKCISTISQSLKAEKINAVGTEASAHNGKLHICSAGQDRPITIQ